MLQVQCGSDTAPASSFRSPRTRVKAIITAVAEKHGVAYRDIMSRDKSRAVVAARQEAYFAVWTDTGWGIGRVAIPFGRDRTTVAHGIGAHITRHDLEGNWMSDRVIRKAARAKSAQDRRALL